MPSDLRLLPVADVAKRLGVCPSTVYNLIAAKKLRVAYLPNVRGTRVRVDDVDALIEASTK